MTIPTSGAFTSETVRAEWGGSYPMTSATVAAWAGLSAPWTSEQLRGKSAFGLSISVGGQTQQTVGNKFIVYRRVITATITGIVGTPSYTWTNNSTYHATSMSASGSPTVTLSLSVDPNDFESNGFDSGTVTCSIVNGDGRTATASANWSLG